MCLSRCVYVTHTLECIIVETRSESVVVESNGLGPVLAAIMHPERPLISLSTCLEKTAQKPFNLTRTESVESQ
jgi:hypothetical protein